MGKKIELIPFDGAEWIQTSDDVIDAVNDAFESRNPAYVAAVLGDIARSEGMTKLASRTGVNRQALYTALSESGNPTLETLLKVTSALNLKLKCEVDLPKAA